MADQNLTTTKTEQPGFWRRTRLYLLEYTLYHSFLIILLSYIAYTFYALFWGIAGKPLNMSLVQANVWFIAGGFVFAPLAYLLHSRTRWEEVAHPARHKQGLRQAIMYIQLIVAIIAGVTFLLVGVINLLRVAVGLTDMSTLLTIAIPSLLNAVITAIVVLDIFTHNSRRSLKVFRPTFFGVCILANITLLIITIVFGQSVRHDLQTMRDLKVITEEISEQYSQTRVIPSEVSDLDIDEDIISRASSRNYEIERTGLSSYLDKDNKLSSEKIVSDSYSYGSYKICAEFEKHVGGSYQQSYGFNIDAEHGKGRHCFNQSVSYSRY